MPRWSASTVNFQVLRLSRSCALSTCFQLLGLLCFVFAFSWLFCLCCLVFPLSDPVWQYAFCRLPSVVVAVLRRTVRYEPRDAPGPPLTHPPRHSTDRHPRQSHSRPPRGQAFFPHGPSDSDEDDVL